MFVFHARGPGSNLGIPPEIFSRFLSLCSPCRSILISNICRHGYLTMFRCELFILFAVWSEVVRE